MKKFFVLGLALFLMWLAALEQAQAIPAFARKYKLSCQTCHSPIPRLKAYGDEFAGNGFKLADKEASRYYVDTGDEDLSLIRDFPFAARLDGHLTYNTNENNKQGDFGVPYTLKLMSGGELANDIAYYFYFYMSERGEIAGVEDCYIMFNNLFDVDLDLYVGQFQVSDPLFKRELRLTLEDYQLYKTRPGMSNMNLAYDRGLMLTFGMETGTDIILEVVNGCGLRHADEDKLFDQDAHKTIVGRVSQDIGESFRIGGFFLTGKEDMENEAENMITNNVMAFGPDLTVSMGDKLELNLQYMQRKDDKLYVEETDADHMIDSEMKGAMAELLYTPDGDESKWYCAGLFNWIESDIDLLNYRTGTLHFGYLLKRNLRIVAEGTYNFTDGNNTYMQFGIGFVSAF